MSGESKKAEKANSTSGKGGGALRSLPFRALDFVIVAEITTPDGLNTVVIKNGEARMEHAECADERCVRSGAASPAKPVVCLPNRVVVTVTGSEEADSVSW